jgi:serine/threonine-protein kinase
MVNDAAIACSVCRTTLRGTDRFCAACGARVNACRACGSSLVAGDRSCPTCGADVDAALITAPTERFLGDSGSRSEWTGILEQLQSATLGEFQVIRELGRGGMAAVFLAHDIHLDRKVAIKVMSPALAADESMVERFRKEARTGAGLKHPNIGVVHRVLDEGGLHFFVMDFVFGRPLDVIIRTTGPLPIAVVRALLYQVGSGLAYAHRRKIYHRDVKPANILVSATDQAAVLTDFGIAKVAASPAQTQTGAMIGTPAYMAPEQVLGSEITGAADQYALGIVAFEMLTGAPPFEGTTYAVMRAHAESEIPSVRVARPECPSALADAIARMVAKSPADRWESLGDALAAMGATMLAEDDPVRDELARLATPNAAEAARIATHTPSSPAPSARRNRAERALPDVPAQSPAPPPVEHRDAVAPVKPAADTPQAAVLRRRRAGLYGSLAVLVTMAILAPPLARRMGEPTPATGNKPPSLPPATGAPVMDQAARPSSNAAPPSQRFDSTPLAKQTVANETSTPTAPMRIIVATPPAIHVGESVQLAASVENSARTAPRITWASNDVAIAQVDPTGRVVGIAEGRTTLSASFGAARSDVSVTVLPALIASLDVPSNRNMLVDESFRATATPHDARGAALRGRSITWSSDHPEIAAVDAEGTVRGRSAGTATITAEADGKSARFSVSISQPAPVTPNAPAPTVVDDRAAVAEAFRTAVGAVVDALRAHDAARALELLGNDVPTGLLGALRAWESTRFRVLAEPQLGTAKLTSATATLDYSLRISYVSAGGTSRPRTLSLQTELIKSGGAWRASRSHLLGGWP